MDERRLSILRQLLVFLDRYFQNPCVVANVIHDNNRIHQSNWGSVFQYSNCLYDWLIRSNSY